MGLLGGRKRSEEEVQDEQFSEAMIVNEQEGYSEQMMRSLAQSRAMFSDPDIFEMVKDDDNLRPLLPLCSHLIRVTNFGKGKEGMREKRMFDLNVDYAVAINEMRMNEDEYETQGWTATESLKVWIKTAGNDAMDGWKARMTSEFRKIVRAEITKPQKKGLF